MSPVAQFAFVVLILYLILRVAANLLHAVRSDALSEQEARESDDEPIMRRVSGKTYSQVWHVGRQGTGDQQEADVEEARWRDV